MVARLLRFLELDAPLGQVSSGAQLWQVRPDVPPKLPLSEVSAACYARRPLRGEEMRTRRFGS